MSEHLFLSFCLRKAEQSVSHRTCKKNESLFCIKLSYSLNLKIHRCSMWYLDMLFAFRNSSEQTVQISSWSFHDRSAASSDLRGPAEESRNVNRSEKAWKHLLAPQCVPTASLCMPITHSLSFLLIFSVCVLYLNNSAAKTGLEELQELQSSPS